MTDRKEIFERIYRDKLWGEGSGGGSSAPVSKPFADIASHVIRENHVRRVLDIGCGDGSCGASIELYGASYTGIDISDVMVERCRESHPALTFVQGDAIEDPLPPADLVLLKEVTQHLSDHDIHMLIDRLRDYPLVLHCSYAGNFWNAPLAESGATRAVSLGKVPFGLPVRSMGWWEFGGATYHAELWNTEGYSRTV